jgi:transcriptional regulator with XRE-family HTH domain
MKSIYEISRRLRETLKASGRTQQEIRLSAGLSRQTMNNVLKGTEDYKLSTLLAVAERLGLELVILPKSAARGLEEDSNQNARFETFVDRAIKGSLNATEGPDVMTASGKVGP